MRRIILAAALAAVVGLPAGGTAHAAGWQGGDHSILRDGFAQGWTLRRLWARLDNR